MDRETVPAAARPWFALAVTALLASGVLAQEPDSAPAPDFESEFAAFEGAPPAHDHPDSAVDLTTLVPPPAPDAGADAGEVIEHLGHGRASFYGRRFAGRPTASGERFDPQGLTAAHRTLPFGSRVRVTNPANGRSVVVRINDRGPFHSRRVIDISRAAAEEIGLVSRGVGEVELELLAD